MRISRLKLVNFIGIKHGIDEDEIELNFPDNGLVFTIIDGDNGSGKSTILSQLHPFKDSFDERKDLIIDGCEGRKEIDIEHDGNVYNIVHVYGKTSKSFISKNGVELNNNGGVRAFEDIVNMEFGLTKDYFNIGKIGSNTKNFIEFSTSERKEYISKFVEGVEKYNGAYTIVSEKFKLDTEKLKDVSKNLKKYSDKETLKGQLETNINELKSVEEKIIENSNKLAVAKSKLKDIEDSLDGIDYNVLITNQNRLTKLKFDLSSRITALETKYPRDSEFFLNLDNIDKYREELINFRSVNAVMISEFDNLKNKNIELNNQLLKIEYQLNGIERGDASVIENEVEELRKEKDQLEENINSSKFNEFVNKENISTVPIMLSKYELFMKFLLKYYTELNEKDIDPSKANITMFFRQDFQEILKSHIIHTRESIKTARDLKESKNAELGSKHANVNKLEILAQRPIECKIDHCPFIRDALSYQNLPEEIEVLTESINQLSNNIDSMMLNADKLDEVKILYKNMLYNFRELNAANNPVYRYASKIFGNVSTLTINKTLNEITEIYTNVKYEVEKYIDDFNRLNTVNSTLENRLKSMSVIKSSESFAEHYIQEQLRIKEEISKNIDSINIYKENTEKGNSELNRRQEILSDMESYIANKNNYKNISENLDTLNEKIDSVEESMQIKLTLTNDIKNSKMDLDRFTKEKSILEANIEKIKFDLLTIDDLTKKMDELNESYTYLKLVKDALDPKSGIPLIFIQSYLGGTEVIANEFLNLAFDGKFEIKFISGPKDFFIQVRTDDNLKPDIKLASQGEIALTTISISLALIEQSIGEFNILALDEIDGALDVKNREHFINILNAQITKLGIEQVFIISHNNAFDAVPMNLISLSRFSEKSQDEAFMRNKNIIYKRG